MRSLVLPRLAVLLTLCAAPVVVWGQALNPTRSETDAFLKADRNGDRELDPPEFREFVRAMADAGQATAKQIRFFGAYGMAFRIADADGNGRVTPWELRAADNDHREKAKN